MAVYHFVLHVYGSWHPDHPDGWHQHGEVEALAPQAKLGQYRRDRQRWDEARFPERHHSALAEMIVDVCERRRWRAHASAVTLNHIHALVSWREEGVENLVVQATLKRLLGWKLAALMGVKGRRWFSDGGRPVAVENPGHFDFLVGTYFKDQGGYYWREER